MYYNPYFHTPFFPPLYRRCSPKPIVPLEKTNKYNDCSQNASKTNVGVSNASPSTKNSTVQEKKQENRATGESPIFEFLGINLYFDDLLILGLLLFLYSEGVQDQELFLALILLLFS